MPIILHTPACQPSKDSTAGGDWAAGVQEWASRIAISAVACGDLDNSFKGEMREDFRLWVPGFKLRTNRNRRNVCNCFVESLLQ